MPKGVYDRKKKKKPGFLNSGNIMPQRDDTKVTSVANCRVVMSLQVPYGGAEIKLTNNNDRVIGTLELTTDGIRLSRPNQKKKADRILTYMALSRLMELGLL